MVLRRSSGLRRVSGTSLLGCSAMSLMSRTYVTDELDFMVDPLADVDLWGSCGADEPSCCSMPLLDIRHSWERFPGSYSHQCILRQKWRNHMAHKAALIFISLTLSARHGSLHCIVCFQLPGFCWYSTVPTASTDWAQHKASTSTETVLINKDTIEQMLLHNSRNKQCSNVKPFSSRWPGCQQHQARVPVTQRNICSLADQDLLNPEKNWNTP